MIKPYFIQIIEVSLNEYFIANWKHPRTEAQIVSDGVTGFNRGNTAPIYSALAEIEDCTLKAEMRVPEGKQRGDNIKKFLLENFEIFFPGKTCLNVKK